MRLTDEDVQKQKKWLEQIRWTPEWVMDLLDTIEAQQQEIEGLKMQSVADHNTYIQQHDCIIDYMKKSAETQQQIQQLQAQNGAYREALEKAREDIEEMGWLSLKLPCTCKEHPTRTIVCEKCFVVKKSQEALAKISEVMGK